MSRAALLFDLDGTMLVSDPIHEAVFAEIWREHGLEVEEDFYNTRVHGRLNIDIFSDFLPDHPDPVALGVEKEARYRERLPRPYPAMPGLSDLIALAQANDWALAVVTNAPRQNAEAMLEAIGLRNAFGVIICGDECVRGKPDPEPYLEAMRELGVTPENSIAFEDSPSGIRAAHASGAFTIGIRSSLDDATLRTAGADASLIDFTDTALPGYLERLKGVSA
ncbi:MAG: HAD family phosphatase [Maritimibacter sp.]